MSRRLLLLGLFFLAAGGVFADLQDLKKDVESAEQSSDKDKEKDKGKGKNQAPVQTAEEKQRDEALAKLVGLIWFADNLGTTFGAHPYAPGGWVRIPAWWDAARTDGTVPLLTGRDQWWSGEAQGFFLDGLGTGAWTSWKGYAWRFVGPYLEGWTLSDGKGLLSGGRAGLLFSLIQADPFNLSFYLQAQGWTGTLVRGGGAGGFELRSYPLEPLEIQIRLGVQGFSGFQIGEFEAQAGWSLGAFTVFGGLRSWSLGDGTSKPASSVWAGGFGGVRWYF